MSEDANERYECLRCETSMAPEDLRARVVTATYYEPAYTEFVCPWCGGEVEELIEAKETSNGFEDHAGI